MNTAAKTTKSTASSAAPRPNTARVDHLYQDLHEEHVRFFMHYGDLTDATNLIYIIQNIQLDEIYNLAA